MCRYALYGPYKRHLVCFGCRKAFKRPSPGEYLQVKGLAGAFAELQRLAYDPTLLAEREKKLGTTLSELEELASRHPCPECDQPMADMGLDFKAPRRADVQAWNRLRSLYKTGHVFHSCGCYGPGWIPASSADLIAYLRNRRETYEKCMREAQNDSSLSPTERSARVSHWSQRVSVVEAELRAAGTQ
jgi:hypothetical protein